MSKKMLATKFLSFITAFALLAMVALSVAPVQAAGTVNTCTRAALVTAIGTGGDVNFGRDCTITYTADDEPHGQIEIPVGITTINANGHKVILDGGGEHRLFYVPSGSTLILNDLTLRNGLASPSSNPAPGVTPIPAFVKNHGGAIFNEGTLTVNNSTFIGNRARGVGTDEGWGGAINNYGTATITNSTFSGNIAAGGDDVITNPNRGGAISNVDDGEVTIINSTFSGNTAETGSAIHVQLFGDAGFTPVTILRNSIASGNTGPNCGSRTSFAPGTLPTITNGGGNVVYSDTTCPGTNSNPRLAGLADNGGLTPTFALMAGSPAIDRSTSNCPATDQRGVARTSTCDSGAYEAGSIFVSVTSSAVGNTSVYGTSVTFTATVDPVPTLPASVHFTDNLASLPTVALDETGHASFTTSTLGAGVHPITATYTDGSAAGTASGSVSQYVTPAAVTVTAAAKSKLYGASDPAFTYTPVPALLAGNSFTGALARNPGEDVGDYAILQGTLSAGPNYTITYVGANLTINPRPITVMADAKTKVYGETDPALTYQYTGTLIGTDAFTGALNRVAGENAGDYAIQQNTLALTSNYALTYEGANLTIEKAVLTFKADDKVRRAGVNNPPFTYTVTGFVRGDTAATALTGSPTLTTTATISSPVGNYAITFGTGTLVATNYSFNFVNATLYVTSNVYFLPFVKR